MTLRVAHITSEAVPFSKTGGLADVLGALPPALAALGAEVTVVVPAHRRTLDEEVTGTVAGVVSALGFRATIHETERRGTRVLLLDCPPLFVRPGLYGVPDGDFGDSSIRFAFFARAALTALLSRGGADVLHAHDWQSALVPLLARRDPGFAGPASAARTVLTIHNLAYQGVFPAWVLEPCGLPRGLFTVETLEFFGQVNFLKGGLVSADAVTTVSPTYAAEILTPAFGCGLEGVLAARRGSLVGILNGIDPDAWNPATDRHLPRRYGPGSVTSGKRAARGALADLVGVGGGGRPLVGMVSRLAEQKGADLLADVVDRLIELGLDIVVLGTGERRYEELLRGAQAAHPGRVHLEARFDEHLAHLIYAASDLFLMPSRYEPCGLGQMIAMRYGTVPIVHRTGGLVDSVTDIGDADGTGVLLDELSSTALIAAVSRALNLVADAGALLAVRRRGMGRDFSWAASAGRYLDLYRRLVAAG